MKFRKKPVEIEAVRLGWGTWNEVCDFAQIGYRSDWRTIGGWAIPGEPDSFSESNATPGPGYVLAAAITTLEGTMIAHEGDWIIKGIQGELYPCKPDIFEATYEPVAEA